MFKTALNVPLHVISLSYLKEPVGVVFAVDVGVMLVVLKHKPSDDGYGNHNDCLHGNINPMVMDMVITVTTYMET